GNFFFQAEDGIRDFHVTGVQTCALPIYFCHNRVRDLQLINKVKASEVEEEVLLDFNRIKNKEVVIGGIVAAANHRIAKSGKPFGSFIIEDYSDSFEIMVFGEDYIKFKGYLQEGLFVQIRGLVQERF